MKTLLILQHEDSTTAGTTLQWAKQRNIEVQTWRADRESPPKNLDSFLGIVICGGTMDTFEEEKFPWLVAEKDFLKRALALKTKMFGLCLGSQLLAEVLGGKVLVHPGWEIGFIPVKNEDSEALSVFHWHHCTFELPPKSVRFLTNDFCANQAFRYEDHVVATQFHPESTEEWVRQCSEEVEEHHQGLVQSKQQMLDSLPERAKMQEWYFEQLDRLFLKP